MDWHEIIIPQRGTVKLTLLRRQDIVKRNHLGASFLFDWQLNWASGTAALTGHRKDADKRWNLSDVKAQMPTEMLIQVQKFLSEMPRDISVGTILKMPCSADRTLSFEFNFGTALVPESRFYLHLGHQVVGLQVKFPDGKTSFHKLPRPVRSPPETRENKKLALKELKLIILPHREEFLQTLLSG